MAIEVEINGEKRSLGEGATVASVLRELAIEDVRIAVERNGRIVRRVEHATTMVGAGDKIEIVTLVGGG